MYDKVAMGTLGTLGTSYVAYKILFPWLGLDFDQERVTARFAKLFVDRVEAKTYVIDMFEASVDRHPDKYFLIYNDEIFTYSRVEEEANKIARVAQTWNLQKRDVVAMFMHNAPDFVWTFMGLQKLGIPISLINYNLRHKALVHCLNVCNAKAVICGGDKKLIAVLEEIRQEINHVPVYVNSMPWEPLPLNFICLQELTGSMAGSRTDKSLRDLEDLDALCYVYTSGTTGMPKPALLTQLKGIYLSGLLDAQAHLIPEDIVYTCLPLYHSSGLFLGLLSVSATGSTMVISKKFSATRFWQECRRHRVTVIQYIGELLRYLLAQPESSWDGVHNIRVAYGNGLRQDIWEKFQKRFRIPHIAEIFGATEGVYLFVNIHNKIGAIGRYSPYLEWRDASPKVLVKYDLVTAKPLRDKTGRCIRVKRGEPGLLLAAFPEHIKPETLYLGNPDKVEEKIVRNVLADGDIFFNFGDILYRDKDYFLYFSDRIGDTFRWKGENVSTLEVANAISNLDFLLDTNVYGVTVPGHDGRAGMACLVLKDRQTELTEDMRSQVFQLCHEDLPKYARPLFLRVQRDMILTDTMKQRKVELVQDGFDIKKITDALYCLDDKLKTYMPLTEQLYFRLMAGDSKL